MPPLREHTDDILLFAAAWLPGLAFSPAATGLLHAYPRPENLSELRGVLERAVVLAQGQPVDEIHLPERVRAAPLPHTPFRLPQEGLSLEELEIALIKQVLAQAGGNKSRAAEYARDPSRFLGRPKLPKYKAKDGRNGLTYTIQAISVPRLRQGMIALSGLDVEVPTKQTRVQQVRLVPRGTHYDVEVVYERDVTPADVNPEWLAGLDLGVDVLAAIATNKPGVTPRLVNGRPIKSLNQAYNKARARLQAKLPEGRYTSRQLDALADARNRRLRDYLHNASRAIVDRLVQERIGTLIIGYNAEWKQGVNLGRRTNQTLVSIPFHRFIQMLTYKAELVGIRVTTHQEAYTSKCSFIDGGYYLSPPIPSTVAPTSLPTLHAGPGLTLHAVGHFAYLTMGQCTLVAPQPVGHNGCSFREERTRGARSER